MSVTTLHTNTLHVHSCFTGVQDSIGIRYVHLIQSNLTEIRQSLNLFWKPVKKETRNKFDT